MFKALCPCGSVRRMILKNKRGALPFHSEHLWVNKIKQVCQNENLYNSFENRGISEILEKNRAVTPTCPHMLLPLIQ